MTIHADLVAHLRAIAARFDMTSTERYEQDSEAFYAATGYMAPGKDVPMAMGGQDETERRAAHESWISGRNRSQQRAIQEAADALAALPPPADPPTVCPECGDPLSCIACEAREDARPEWRTSFGWMIEARFGGVPHWFEGIGSNSSGPTYRWTTDPARGIRLCRREDVVALIDSLNEGASVPMRGYPSQHGWCDLRPEVVTPIGAHVPADPPALVALRSSLLTGLEAIRQFASPHAEHTNRCNGDEDTPCDCGAINPRDVAEALYEQLLAYPLPAALPPPADPPMVPESPLAHAAVEATARAHGWDAEQDTLAGWLHRRLSRPADPLYEYCPSCRRLGPLFGLTAIRSEETGGRHCISCFGKTESRLLPLWTAPPADPPALVALVREWQKSRVALREAEHPVAYDMAEQVYAVHERALLTYPLPAAPPVTDEHEAAAREIMTLLTPLVTDAAIVGRSYGWPDVLAVVRVVAAKLRPPVTDTPQGCPTCGGPRPCDRCTTSNVVDLDALKARLENERLRAAAEIVKLISDDSWAITFQSLGQYRSALLKAWRDSAPAAPPQEDQ